MQWAHPEDREVLGGGGASLADAVPAGQHLDDHPVHGGATPAPGAATAHYHAGDGTPPPTYGPEGHGENIVSPLDRLGSLLATSNKSNGLPWSADATRPEGLDGETPPPLIELSKLDTRRVEGSTASLPTRDDSASTPSLPLPEALLSTIPGGAPPPAADPSLQTSLPRSPIPTTPPAAPLPEAAQPTSLGGAPPPSIDAAANVATSPPREEKPTKPLCYVRGHGVIADPDDALAMLVDASDTSCSTSVGAPNCGSAGVAPVLVSSPLPLPTSRTFGEKGPMEEVTLVPGGSFRKDLEMVPCCLPAKPASPHDPEAVQSQARVVGALGDTTTSPRDQHKGLPAHSSRCGARNSCNYPAQYSGEECEHGAVLIYSREMSGGDAKRATSGWSQSWPNHPLCWLRACREPALIAARERWNQRRVPYRACRTLQRAWCAARGLERSPTQYVCAVTQSDSTMNPAGHAATPPLDGQPSWLPSGYTVLYPTSVGKDGGSPAAAPAPSPLPADVRPRQALPFCCTLQRNRICYKARNNS